MGRHTLIALLIMLSVEIYHLVKKQAHVSSPFIVGLLSSTFWGLIVICYMKITSSSGEGGLAAIVAAPAILLTFLAVGALIAGYYKLRGKVFCYRLIEMMSKSKIK